MRKMYFTLSLIVILLPNILEMTTRKIEEIAIVMRKHI